jgi:hypothetical protein
MWLQQGGVGIRSLITRRNTGFFARYRRSANSFRAFSAARRPVGHVLAAAKYRADNDRAGAARRALGMAAMSASSPPDSFAHPFINAA